jgi:integrase
MSPKVREKYRKTIRINGKSLSQRFTRKADAEEWYSKMLLSKERARSGLEVPFEPIAIEAFCADFIAGRTRNETNELDETRIRLYFLPAFGPTLDEQRQILRPGRDLHSITRKEWKGLFASLITKHGLAEKTVNNIRALAHRIYEEARTDEPPRVTHNPIADIRPFKGADKEIEIFETKEEIHLYLEAAEHVDLSSWMAAMIALNTGLREGEISALDEQDVNLPSRSIRVYKTWSHAKRQVNRKTKTKHQRTLGINDALAAAIVHYRSKRPGRDQDAPFVTLPDGRRLPGDSILTRHKAALEKAKLPYRTFHATRHTFATHFLASGGSVWDLKNILGHKSVTTTERYAHRLMTLIQMRSGVFQVQTPSLAAPIPVVAPAPIRLLPAQPTGEEA